MSPYRLNSSQPDNSILVFFLPQVLDDHSSLLPGVLQDIVQILHLEGDVLHEVSVVSDFVCKVGLFGLVLSLEDENYL